MKKPETFQNKSIQLKPSRWGWALTMLIIAVRAFQPGAVPVSEWSWWSWLLMLAPVLFAIYFYIFLWAVYVCGMAFLLCLDLFSWTWKKLVR